MKAKAHRRNSKAMILKKGRFMQLMRKGEWEYVERNNCSGIVIIVAMTDDQKVIFVEQYRPPVDKKVIEFPAGLVNDQRDAKTESFKRAAKRELIEESGYQAKDILLLLQGPVSSGSSGDLVTMVRATGLKKITKGGGVDESESIIVHEIDLNDVDAWLKTMESQGYLVEPKIYTGLYFLKNYNRARYSASPRL